MDLGASVWVYSHNVTCDTHTPYGSTWILVLAPFWFQLPADDHPGIHMEGVDWGQGVWLQPGPPQAGVVIWGVIQQIDRLLSLCLSIKLTKEIH